MPVNLDFWSGGQWKESPCWGPMGHYSARLPVIEQRCESPAGRPSGPSLTLPCRRDPLPLLVVCYQYALPPLSYSPALPCRYYKDMDGYSIDVGPFTAAIEFAADVKAVSTTTCRKHPAKPQPAPAKPSQSESFPTGLWARPGPSAPPWDSPPPYAVWPRPHPGSRLSNAPSRV